MRRGVPQHTVEFKQAGGMEVANMIAYLHASLSQINAWFSGNKSMQSGLGNLARTKPQASAVKWAEDTVLSMRINRAFSEWHQWLLRCFLVNSGCAGLGAPRPAEAAGAAGAGGGGVQGGCSPILPTQWRVVQEQCGLCAPWRGLCTSRCGALCAGCAGLGAPRPAEAVRAPRELHRDTLAPCHGDPHRSHVHASVPLHCGLNPL